MNILGISAFYHDSAACLLSDGQLVAAAQEERFSRKRHDAGFPERAIQYCLQHAKVSIDEIDFVAYYEKPFLKFERILETLVENAPASYGLALKALPIWLKEKLWIRKKIARELGKTIPLLFSSHHESHAASSFFPSPYEEAATLTIDGVGEWSTTTWGIGKGNRLELKAEISFPHSIGLLYSAFTQYLGFRVNSAEYKVMGLAPYGEPKYADLLKNHVIEIFEDGSFLLNMDYFSYLTRQEMISPKLEELFGVGRRSPESDLTPFHADIAKSLQTVTEEVMLKLAHHVHRETQSENLCLAGGVALNCVANGRIMREGPFKNIWIQPAAGDAGGAVGAAYIAWHHVCGEPRHPKQQDSQQGSYLGPGFQDEEIESTLKGYGIRFDRHSSRKVIERTAEFLEHQQVVGWFQGRMEFGPRALGNRSILGDARNPEMQKRMNLKIKFRESFRPFAPSFLEDAAEDYFQLEGESPYMLLTCPVRKYQVQPRMAVGDKWMSEMLSSNPSDIPAVTHVDGSARAHSVNRQRNSSFYELISAFYQKTGSPVLINTSFNVRGEPIVCTPNDALRCFVKTNMDVLTIGNYIVQRKDQDPEHFETLRNQIVQEDRFDLD